MAAVAVGSILMASQLLSFDVRGPSKGSQIQLPSTVKVAIEVPKGSVVKRHPDGSLDFLLPLPCPFNYGSVYSLPALDGDPMDAIVLGDHLPYGHEGTWEVKGMLKFIDAGIVDNKLVCVQPSQQFRPGFKQFRCGLPPCMVFGEPALKTMELFQQGPLLPLPQSPSILDYWSLSCLFSAYAMFKGGLNSARGKHGSTSFEGWELLI